ncbi:IS110 family transposase [Thermoactinomyces sp. DSM 45892]|uniref:IS110 family transposase n=1 Tax=Thermoactinomyces sp. DSM 45892 TaxID=1882753 RepID=UPI000898F5C7|nr:IS110 family transposase [Thermoactinomyces sp. DSM 45892]SDZ38996.1 Transposase IS116/IS110/IS902 family protein [Thermoactinomyces sp. DSM 45892]
MNFNVNRQLEQLTPETLIVGVDIAKNKHVARVVDDRGKELAKPIAFANSQEGFQQLLFWMKSTQIQQAKEQVILGMEPTGHYWLNLAHFMKSRGIQVVIVNPMHVKRTKELDDNSPTKNDVKDAHVIARLIQGARYSVPHFPEGIHAELRVLMNLRDRVNQEFLRVQGRITNWLDRYFPEFVTVFKDWQGKAAMLSLQHFPLPVDVQCLGAERIVAVWKLEVKRAVGLGRAEKLVRAAQETVGLTIGSEMARFEIQMLLEQHHLYQEQLEQVGQKVEDLLHQIPGTKEMQSIPGVGLLTVAGFLAEVGDLQRYQHPDQIRKLAGLNLKEYSSGKHKGKTQITKRGRPRLRALLFRCVMPLVVKNSEFKAFHRHFTTRSRNPLSKKQSMVALCCKLIRLLFVLGNTQTSYDPAKLQRALQRSTLQIVA